MRLFWKRILIGLLGLGIQSCGYVDDYILGKDNTILPKPLPKIHPKINLQPIWTAKIGQSKQTQTYYKLKPVTLGKKIYTADTSGRVTALSEGQGKILWTTPLEKNIVSGPAVGHGLITVGTDDGFIVALSQFDGHVIWQSSVASEVLAKTVVTSQSVIAKTMDGHLYALDLQQGKKQWGVEHGAPNLILKASSSPVISGDTVLVGHSDGKLDAVNLGNGHVIWQRSIAYPNGASDVERLIDIDADPILRKSIIYMASYQGFIGAFDIVQGQFVWSKQASVYKNMAMDEDTLYVTDSHDVIWAYQSSTGQVKWKQNALRGHGLTEPVLLGSNVIVGDKKGRLHILAKAHGALIGRQEVGAPIYISPEVSHDRILVMTSDGVIQAYKVHPKS